MSKSLYDYCIENERSELLAQWDTEHNSELSPHDVPYGDPLKVWWKCEKGHIYQAPIRTRTVYNTGCPVCAGKKIIPGENDLASNFPHIAKQWHPSKNGDMTPEEVTAFSNRTVWWLCPNGHEYTAKIAHRTREMSACPYCAGRKVLVGFNDLATKNPAIAAQWHPTLNGELTPDKVTEGSNTRVWWQCSKGHVWQATVGSRTSKQKNGCPVCGGRLLVLGENDLASQFPHIAAQWHPTKNGDLTPEKMLQGSNKIVWWRCDLGHEYEAKISDRTSRPYGCPYCSGKRVLAGFNDLATKDPAVAAQWHSELNGELTPDMVTIGSRKKVWWQCSEGHVWQAIINSRARGQKSGCPVCVGAINVRRLKRYQKIEAEDKLLNRDRYNDDYNDT